MSNINSGVRSGAAPRQGVGVGERGDGAAGNGCVGVICTEEQSRSCQKVFAPRTWKLVLSHTETASRTQLAAQLAGGRVDGFCFSKPKTLGLLRCLLLLAFAIGSVSCAADWPLEVWHMGPDWSAATPPHARAVGRFERLGPMVTSPRAKQAVVLC